MYIEVEGQQWFLLYDFKGIKPGTKFYTNLTRLSTFKGRTALIQYSALLTTSRSARMRGARMYVGDGVRERVWV
jgi:hypothetical protein